jgi:hypothetical protein
MSTEPVDLFMPNKKSFRGTLICKDNKVMRLVLMKGESEGKAIK